MKKWIILSIILFVLVLLGCTKKEINNKGPFEWKNENGIEVLYSNGKLANGSIEIKVKGFEEEYTKRFYVKNGLIYGKVKTFYNNGDLMSEINYRNGEREGKAIGYNENGEVEYLENYKNNKLDGHIEEYFSGHLMYKANYKNGEIKDKIYYYVGTDKVFSKIIYINNKQDGKYSECVEYYNNGNIKSKEIFKDGKSIKKINY